ncbi:MAG: ParB/RepB/Spo0J family partition protein [Flavobacteriaceae bacterium]
MAKANKKQVLGRGLSALLNDPQNEATTADDQMIGNVIDLDLSQIEINPYQPRTHFNQDALEELARSIEALGVIQPITVRKIAFQKYQLVSGERRFRASQSIGLQKIPAFVRIANDQESLEMALVENIQREDLDPIEIALSYQRLIEEITLTQDALSLRVGKKRSTITNYLRLLRLDPIIQTGMRDGFISMGHGRALVTIDDRSKQLDLYEKILSNGLSVRATEALVQKGNQKDLGKKTKPESLPEKEMSYYKRVFGKKVQVQLNSSGGGRLVIPFSSKKELKEITKKIKGAD